MSITGCPTFCAGAPLPNITIKGAKSIQRIAAFLDRDRGGDVRVRFVSFEGEIVGLVAVD
jgi:sulfite reductase beta subunit-like hemoprotein